MFGAANVTAGIGQKDDKIISVQPLHEDFFQLE